MSETPKLKIPFLQASQAQKHVTVNEAFSRLDALSQISLISISQTTVPTMPLEGDCYSVPPGALGEWGGHVGKIASFSNGSWSYFDVIEGWQAWVEEEFQRVEFVNGSWRQIAVSSSPGGAETLQKVSEFDHVIGSGITSTTGNVIPAYALVFGITGRVIDPLTGSGLTSWQLGVAGSPDRYGSGLGISLNSWVKGLTGSPLTYWTDTPLLLSAETGSFTAGSVRLAVHYLALKESDSV